MSPTKLRLLAFGLDEDSITREDAKAWATELRGMAKDLERLRAEVDEAMKRVDPNDISLC